MIEFLLYINNFKEEKQLNCCVIYREACILLLNSFPLHIYR